MDWQFRILTDLASDFASDLNAMIVANGYPAVMPANWDGAQSVVMPPIGAIRLDFDTFTLPSGLHVNARLTSLPNASSVIVAQYETLWSGAISSWFGKGGTQPACPTLVNYTNTAPSHFPNNGGQAWKSTGKTILISPSPSVVKRSWA